MTSATENRIHENAIFGEFDDARIQNKFKILSPAECS